MRRVTLAAVCAIAVLTAGCGQLTLMSDGHLVLDPGGSGTDVLGIGGASYGDPVLQAFDAQQDVDADTSDPNSRAGANCSGGVCAIF